MQTITLSHKSLVGDIIITMDGNRGTSISSIGYSTSWVDDSGEDEIFDIAYSWLQWQTDTNYPYEDKQYLGYRWWNDKYTPEERQDFIRKEVFTK